MAQAEISCCMLAPSMACLLCLMQVLWRLPKGLRMMIQKTGLQST